MPPRILLVEDTPDIALWLGTALRQGGMRVEFATDGHAAERCLQPGHDFDAVLLDLQLPGQDGLSVLQRWRSQGQTMGSVASLQSLMAVAAPVIGALLLAVGSHAGSARWLLGLPFFFCAALQAVSTVLAFRHFRRSHAVAAAAA